MSLFEEASKISALEAVEKYAGIVPIRKGNRYVCSCPFPDHQDKNPSFTLGGSARYPLGFICSCGRHGSNAIDFLSQYRGIDRTESAKQICNDFRLNPGSTSRSVNSVQKQKKISERSISNFDTFLVDACNLWDSYIADCDENGSSVLYQLLDAGAISQEQADLLENEVDEVRRNLINQRNRFKQLADDFLLASQNRDYETQKKMIADFDDNTFDFVVDLLNKQKKMEQ